MDVFDLFAKLTMDTSEYEQKLSNAEKGANDLKDKWNSGTQQITSGLKNVGVGVGIFAGIGTAAFKAADNVSKNLDEIDKMSQKIGISAEAYQEWDAVLEHSGASISSLQPIMKTLSNQAQSGAEEFKKLGISEEEVANLSKEDLFSRVIEGLQGMEDGTERTAIASKLLGRGATELGALLNTSAEDTQAMKDRVHELGGVMSDDAVKQGAQFQDSLTDLKASFKGAGNSLLTELLPPLIDLMDKTAEFVASGGLEEIINLLKTLAPVIIGVVSAFAGFKIVTGIISIIQGVVTVFTTLSVLVPILTASFAPLIASMLPFIAVGAAIVAAGVLIYKNWDTIKEKAGELKENISEKWNNIKDTISDKWNAVKDTTSKAWDAIKNKVEENGGGIKGVILTYTDAYKAVWQGAFDVINQATGGKLGEAVSIVGSKLGEIGSSFLSLGSSALTWGKDLIDNFIGGLLAKWESLKKTVSNIAGSIKDLIGFSEPKKGPLSNFHTYAPDMMDLFMKGINDNKSKLINTVTDAFDFQNYITAPSMIDGKISGVGGAGIGSTYNITFNQPVDSAMDVARAIREEAQYGLIGG